MFNTIREKLLSSYLLIALIIAISGLFSIYHVSNMADMTTELVVGHWETEKLIDNAQFKVDQIVQTVLDPDPQFSSTQLTIKVQKELDEFIVFFDEAALGIEVADKLIPLFRRLKQDLAEPLRLHLLPLKQRDKFDSTMDHLLDDVAALGDISLLRQLTHLEWLINDFLLKDEQTLLEEFRQLDLNIRSNTKFLRISDHYELLYRQGFQTIELAMDYRQSRQTFKVTVRELKAALEERALAFDEQIVKPKGRNVSNQFSIVLLIVASSVVISILLAMLLGIFFSGHLSRPLVKIVRMVDELEQGNFDYRLKSERKDEIGRVAQSIDMFADSLQGALSKLESEVIERKQAEGDARENELKYRRLSVEFQALLEGISDSIILVSVDGLVVWANRNTQLQINSPRSNLVGNPLEKLNRLYRFFEDVCCVENTLKSGQAQSGTFRCIDERMFGIKTFPLLNESGELTGVIRMCSDITERHQLNQATIEKSRLASLGELAAGVAHEINNPNALTLLNTPLLIDVFREVIPVLDEYAVGQEEYSLAGLPWAEIKGEVPALLEEMLQGGKKIQQIVEDLKNFVRQGDGLAFEPVEINVAVQAAVRLLGNQIKISTRNFSLTLGDGMPLVRGNIPQIEQVVVNMLQNSCNALTSREEGLHIHTSYDADRGLNLIRVIDDGSGISEEHLPHLTEPFFTTRRNEGGTGLGLSISARIARDHNGSLSFTSSLGQGTIADFQLPVLKGS